MLPLPEDQLARLFGSARTIAVVGASTDPEKQAHLVPAYLQTRGHRVIPVNPRGGVLFGERVVRSLGDIDEPVDVVQVFRPSAEAPAIAAAAAELGASVLWLQVGIVSPEAERIALSEGLTVVMNACMRAVDLKLLRLGLVV